MGANIQFKGVKQLDDALKKNMQKVNLVQDVIKQDSAELQALAMQTVPVRTGDLKRSISISILPLEGHIGTGMHYAQYVELGTRFMNAQPYIKPSYDKVNPRFMEHVRIVMGKDV